LFMGEVKAWVFWIRWSGNKNFFHSYFEAIFTFLHPWQSKILSFRAIHKNIQLGMDKFGFGRTMQSSPNDRIKKVHNIHPSPNLGFHNNLQIHCFICCHSFSPLITTLILSFLLLPSSFPSLFQPINYHLDSWLRDHYNTNHPPDLTLVELLPFVCFVIPFWWRSRKSN
jgi:hypothetical protein